MFQYMAYLEQAGMHFESAPFFDTTYLQKSYSGQSKTGQILRAFERRRKQLRAGTGNRLLWVEKEAMPFVPWFLERNLLPKNAPFVTDYDDAIFHRYDMHANSIIRQILGRKIAHVMAASHTVFAGNAYLADYAKAAGAPRIEIVPTVVDMDIYRVKPEPMAGAKPRIGWIGSPSTWTEFGQSFTDLVCETLAPVDGVFRVVGGGPASKTLSGSEALDWREDQEVLMIQGMDVGIMPLTDTPWARGKCGYKLIQYMACGLPVVASPVGVNTEIVQHGENGFLVSTPEEWKEALTLLLHDPTLRREMGAKGRAHVEANYSLQVWGPRVATLLKDIAE
jgi:glycosyltransferase involved in cell wall biosynthesis